MNDQPPKPAAGKLLVPAKVVSRQIETIFRAQGVREDVLAPMVEIMVETDLRGIDSHGVTMVKKYTELLREKSINPDPDMRVVRETPATALLDADGAPGHAAGLMAMMLACDKAEEVGVGTVAVRDSNHFGAAGAYAMRAAERGLIGLCCTCGWSRAIVPTRGKMAMFGTNPIAFAAPTRRNRTFLLDMATSTVAVGKLNIKWLNDLPVPVGWIVDAMGQPITDAEKAREQIYERSNEGGGLTPLGGTPELSSHKGYGLAAMVQILSSVLAGGIYGGIARGKKSAKGRQDITHFFLAMDPKAYRDEGEFEDDLDAMIDALHATPAADPEKPVLVAGEPEFTMQDQREKHGIPMPRKLVGIIEQIAGEVGVDFILEKEAVGEER
jgi:LDH2 family malate/lactate/ureidoglycolate dehydrogenase